MSSGKNISTFSTALAIFKIYQFSIDDISHVVQSTVDFGKSLGLEVNDEDMKELVDEYNEELATNELQDLHLEVQQTARKKLFQMRWKRHGRTCLIQRLKTSSLCGVRFVEKKKSNRQSCHKSYLSQCLAPF